MTCSEVVFLLTPMVNLGQCKIFALAISNSVVEKRDVFITHLTELFLSDSKCIVSVRRKVDVVEDDLGIAIAFLLLGYRLTNICLKFRQSGVILFWLLLDYRLMLFCLKIRQGGMILVLVLEPSLFVEPAVLFVVLLLIDWEP